MHSYYAPGDPSEASVAPREGLERLRELAQRDAEKLLDTMMDDIELPEGLAVERVVAAGSPAGVLLSRASTDHLLVVGTRGHGVLSRTLFGSVSHQILHHAAGPVVVVP